MRVFGLMLCVLTFLGWAGTRTVDYFLFEREVGGYLKLAADSNTVELAKDNLAVAVDNIERWGMTEGYTSVLWTAPEEDVGFWYKNIKASLEELRAVKTEASQLERSNVLMKLRETLLDNGEKGTKITVPEGITIFPNNILFALWGWLSFIFAIIFGFGVLVEDR